MHKFINMQDKMKEQKEQERVCIRLDVMSDIIRDLDNSIQLQEIFGIPVSRSLVIVAENNDLRIEEGGAIKLSKEENRIFLEILNKIIEENIV